MSAKTPKWRDVPARLRKSLVEALRESAAIRRALTLNASVTAIAERDEAAAFALEAAARKPRKVRKWEGK